MSWAHYDSIEEMPEGMRKLVLAQQEKEARKNGGQQQVSPAKQKILEMTGGEEEKVKARKYRNLPTERLLQNGECIKFGSKKEAAYYDYLQTLVAGGVVRNVKLQYQFLLKPAYTDGKTGERFRAVSYLADFAYEQLEDGKWVEHIVDTKGGGRKGTKTAQYIMKRKFLAEQGIIIEEA